MSRAPSLKRSGSVEGAALLAAALVATLVVPFAHARPNLSSKDMARVQSGGVVTYSLPPRNGGDVRLGKAIGIVEGSPESVVYTLLDANNYHEFVHRVKRAYFVKGHARGIFAVIETSLPWPVPDAWAYVKITYTHLGNHVYRMRWMMQRGTLKQYFATALIEPWNKRLDQCTLTYTMLAEPKTIVPDRLLSKATRHGAEMVLHRVRIRVKTRWRLRKFPRDLGKRYR